MATISVQFRLKGFATRPFTVNSHSVSVGAAALFAGAIKLNAKPVKINSMAIVAVPVKVFFNFNANCVSL